MQWKIYSEFNSGLFLILQKHISVCYVSAMYVCIHNWPLPMGAFQDQCKQIVINKHNWVKNPNWQESDQLAIYKHSRDVELRTIENSLRAV